MLEIPFHQFDHNFCESSIYSNVQHPEYLNAFSSLFITFIGLNALRKPRLHMLLTMMYSCLAVNGVLSFLYHYYNSIGYGLLDRMSMVLLALNTSYIFFITVKKMRFLDIGFYKNTAIHLSIVSYYSLLLTVAGLHKELIFNIMFGIFLCSIIFYVYIISTIVKINSNLLELGWKGVRYIVYSAVFWLTTEGLCNHLFFIKYLFGHVWWHVFVSLGGYLVSLLAQYIFLLDGIQLDEDICIRYDIFRIPYLDYTANV